MRRNNGRVQKQKRLVKDCVRKMSVSQAADVTARLVIRLTVEGKKLKDIPVEKIPEGMDEDEINRLVAQGESMKMSALSIMLVRRKSRVTAARDNRNPGQFERLLFR